MSTLFDSYEKVVSEVFELRREVLDAEDRLLWWVVIMAIGGIVFGILMFVAGSQCEATRQIMGGMR